VVKKYVLNQAETIVLLYLAPSFTCRELATKVEELSSIDDIVFSVNTNKVLLFVVSQVILSLKESISAQVIQTELGSVQLDLNTKLVALLVQAYQALPQK